MKWWNWLEQSKIVHQIYFLSLYLNTRKLYWDIISFESRGWRLQASSTPLYHNFQNIIKVLSFHHIIHLKLSHKICLPVAYSYKGGCLMVSWGGEGPGSVKLVGEGKVSGEVSTCLSQIWVKDLYFIQKTMYSHIMHLNIPFHLISI